MLVKNQLDLQYVCVYLDSPLYIYFRISVLLFALLSTMIKVASFHYRESNLCDLILAVC
jgi:hypothetical protein